MKKISKDSMQQFMLMHAEKLILGACLVATGVFVWTSLGSEDKSPSQSPSDLLGQAKSADTYINKPDAWSGEGSLEGFRKGKVDAKDHITKTQPVDGTKFNMGFLGTAVETLAPRKDPLIFAPEQLIARRITAAVMLNLPYVSPLSEFNAAPKGQEGGGSGLRGGGGDDGDFNGGSDARDGSDTRDGSSSRGLVEGFLPLDRSSEFSEVNKRTITGIRPAGLGVSEKTITNIRDVVCVTAVVDFKKQSAAFENAFAESIGYNANRDRPVYQCLQVQRREVSDRDGQAEWKDITENVTYKYASSNPLKSMPFQPFGSAPEVISPDNFDPILSQAIPAFAQFDYQKLASHPALKTLRQFPAWKAPETLGILPDEKDPDDIFTPVDPNSEIENAGGSGTVDGINSLRNGTETASYQDAIMMREQSGQYRLVRFFDLSAPKKRSYEYRVRVWVGDPNQQDPLDGFNSNRGQQLQVSKNADEAVQFSGTGEGMASMAGMMEEMDKEADSESSDGNNRPAAVMDIQKTMLIISARNRVAAGTDFETMQRAFVEAARQEGPVAPFHVAEYSKEGKLEQVELPPSPGRYAYIQYLRYARPSAWSEPVRVESASPSGDVLAGMTVRKKPIAVELAGRAVEFEQAEPSIKVLVSSWVRTLGARLPSERNAHIGETMNFAARAYVTHPITWEILVPENSKSQGADRYTLPFRSNQTIVDAFYGDVQQLPNDKRQSMELATEILTMDASGNLKVSNQFAEATDYRNELAMPDDSRFFGRERKKRPQKDDDFDLGDF